MQVGTGRGDGPPHTPLLGEWGDGGVGGGDPCESSGRAGGGGRDCVQPWGGAALGADTSPTLPVLRQAQLSFNTDTLC